MTVLVVGGAGYIGSHVCKALKRAGFNPIVFDNLENGHRWAVKWGELIEGDLLDPVALEGAFVKSKPEGVIHLAAYINARESILFPEKYYENNVVGSMKLFETMARHGILKLVFSSTAAVYGNPVENLISETHPCNPINVYGKTKWLVEELAAKQGLLSVALRYFNAAGADLATEIGEAHQPETHLIPLAILSALGKHPLLKVFGTDHPTPDGTPIRDYVHVEDLAQAHVLALQHLLKGGSATALNLGSGCGYSVSEVIAMVEKITKKPVPRTFIDRDPSDPPVLVAKIEKAQKLLSWKPLYDLETMIASALRWTQRS